MSKTDGRPYVRVYLSIIDDDRFAAVYDDDHHLSTWLRLLMLADMLWPAPFDMPASARPASVAALKAAGLIDAVGPRFRVHGLDAERERRSAVGRAGASARWSDGNANADANALQSQSNRNARDASRSVADIPLEKNDDVGVGREDIDAYNVETWVRLVQLSEEMTGKRSLGQPTSKLGERALQQVEDFGWMSVEAAWHKAQEMLPLKPRPSIGQIVLSADNFLRPIPRIDGKAAAMAERADEEDAAHRRKLEATQKYLAELRGTV